MSTNWFKPPVVFLLTFLSGSSVAVLLCSCEGDFIRDVCCVIVVPYLSSVGISGKLCFVILAFLGYLLLIF